MSGSEELQGASFRLEDVIQKIRSYKSDDPLVRAVLHNQLIDIEADRAFIRNADLLLEGDIDEGSLLTKLNHNDYELRERKHFTCGITPERITELGPRDVFVFGSNAAGIHGAGAALLAYRKFGAVYGKGIGRYGQTYAIPTKDHNIETLPLADIEMYVAEAQRYFMEHTSLRFFVTAIGTGLAGYSAEDIAPLFVYSTRLENVTLPAEFLRVILKNRV